MKPPPRPVKQQLADAMTLLQQGRIADAEAALRAILQRDSRNFDAMHLAGVAAVELGRLEEGITRIRRAIAMNPRSSAAHNNLGTALMRLEEFQEALGSFDRAIMANRENPQAHHGRGSALDKLGRLDEAIAAYGRAIALAPNYAEAYCDRGSALAERNDWEAALADQKKAHALNPGAAECLANLALVLCHFKRFQEALAHSEQALLQNPNHVTARTANIMALIGVGRLLDAEAQVDSLINFQPRLPDGYIWRARVLHLLGQPHAALTAAETALQVAPENITALNCLALALGNLNRPEEALAVFDQALKLKPKDSETLWNRALALLVLGRFEEGWRDYEHGKLRHAARLARPIAKPAWLGETPIGDKRVFLYWEQGFGDTIQFARYALLAAADGANVVLSVQEPLRRLFQNFSPAITVIGPNDTPDAFDLHSPLLSLPLAFQTRLETIPAWQDGYLQSQAAEVTLWSRRLPAGRRRIGLVWGGNPLHGNDANRSLPLEKFSPLVRADDAWLSLQKDIREADGSVLGSIGITDIKDEIGDFADTAALISALDLVISVDTSVAHLAGALGKPIWLLLPFAPDFRWFLDRQDSPWYPTMRLFRQHRPGDWDSVIASIGAALQTLPATENPRSVQ